MIFQKTSKSIISLIMIIIIFITSAVTSGAVTFTDYKRNPNFRYGVDVSLWNDDLDWNELRNEGIEFVYIRIGYYDNYGGHIDKRFKQNVIGCVENGIEFGVYVYSYVYSITANKACAQWIDRELKAMGNYCKDKDTIQVAYDIEDRIQVNALLYGKVSKSYMQSSVEAFCNNIKTLGYIPCVYSFSSFFRDYLDVNKLQSIGANIWVAHWPGLSNVNTYEKKYIDGYYPECWQYSDSVTIAGTVFDTNIFYGDFYDYNKEDSKLKIKNLKKYYTYTGKAVTPDFKIYSGKKLLKKGKDYKIIFYNNVEQGRARAKIIRFSVGKYLETKTVLFHIWDNKIKNLNVQSISNKIKLKWSPVDNAESYRIFIYDEILNKYTLLEENQLNYTTISRLDRKKLYKFKIRAIGNVNNKNCKGEILTFNCKTK